MAEITFGGLASGLATNEIVDKLMAVERRPLDRLESELKYETNRLKAYSEFNTLLNEFRDAAGAMNLTSEVRTTKINLSSSDAFAATSNSATTGSYNIAVTQLAQVQKGVSAGYSSNTSSVFGTGSITITDTTLGKATQITIDESNNSLQGVMSAINAESGKTGVSATIINDGSGSATAYRLVLTGKDASTNFSLASSLVDGSSNPIDFSTTPIQNAQQAKMTVDGIEIVSNSNTITGVIAGVTFNLNETSPIVSAGPPPVYTTTKMDVVADNDALKEKISTFVSSYNKIMEWIVSGYEENAASTTSADSGTSDSDEDEESLSYYLRGDATVNSIKRGLQSMLTNVVEGSGSLRILSEIGITTKQDGTLNLNNSKLDSALASNFDGVTKLLAGEDGVDGIMQKFNSYLLSTTSVTKGMYAEKQTRYENKVDQLDQQIEQKTAMLDKIEAGMYARFNAMELLVSNLNSQSSYITQLSSIWSNDK